LAISGRSVLIAGSGRATLDAGRTEDLLIAGTTSWDDNEAELAAILNERNLHGTASLLSSKTVQSNNARNELDGTNTLDLIFADLKSKKRDELSEDLVHDQIVEI
jgi:hypothetical protein